MNIIWTILIGLLVGLVARAMKPGRDTMGLIMTTFVGIGGALLAKFVGQRSGWYSASEPAGLIASVGGAIVLLVLLSFLRKRT